MAYRFLPFILGMALLSGCASGGYIVEVDGISEPPIRAGKFTLFSGVKNVDENDLHFHEYSRIVTNALKAKGYQRVEQLKDADMAIMLSYAISDPLISPQTRYIPNFGSTTTTSTVKGKYGQTLGTVETETPRQGETVTDYVTTYGRVIVLRAFDAKDFIKPRFKDGKPDVKMFWETKISSGGSSGDLRKVFPYMMYAATPYLGINTGEKKLIKVNLNENDHSIRFLKGLEDVNSENRTPSNVVP